MTKPEPLQQVDRTFVRFRRRKLSYFSGCDYFRQATHPRVVAAFEEAVRRHGINVAASRLTTGEHTLYRRLEEELCRFFAAPAALLTSTGYVSNLVVAQALAGEFSHALIDERSHLSLRDAARMLDCPVLEFRHRDAQDLKRCIARCGIGAGLMLLTDGLFAHNGSVAPLKEYLQALPGDSMILVDDAHGAGVLGKHGRGTVEHCGVGRRRVVQTITLSKALGVYGGAVLGSASLRRQMLRRSPLLIGSTPVPLPVAAAALESLAVLRADGGRARQRLARNTAHLREGLRAAGFDLNDHPGPIISLEPQTGQQASRLKQDLVAARILPPLIKYPGGPPAGYFRFAISSEHDAGQLKRLLAALRTAKPAGFRAL